MTPTVTSSASCWCDNCGAFLAPSAVDGNGRPGVQLEVRGVRVILCLRCVAQMHAALLAHRRAEREAR